MQINPLNSYFYSADEWELLVTLMPLVYPNGKVLSNKRLRLIERAVSMLLPETHRLLKATLKMRRTKVACAMFRARVNPFSREISLSSLPTLARRYTHRLLNV